MSDQHTFDTIKDNEWELILDITCERREITRDDWERHAAIVKRLAASFPPITSRYPKISLKP